MGKTLAVVSMFADQVRPVSEHEIAHVRVVHAVFKLTPNEIGLIERATKYPYGELKQMMSPESICNSTPQGKIYE